MAPNHGIGLIEEGARSGVRSELGVRRKSCYFFSKRVVSLRSHFGGPGEPSGAIPGGPEGAPGGRPSAPTAMDGSDDDPQGVPVGRGSRCIITWAKMGVELALIRVTPGQKMVLIRCWYAVDTQNPRESYVLGMVLGSAVVESIELEHRCD